MEAVKTDNKSVVAAATERIKKALVQGIINKDLKPNYVGSSYVDFKVEDETLDSVTLNHNGSLTFFFSVKPDSEQLEKLKKAYRDAKLSDVDERLSRLQQERLDIIAELDEQDK